MVHIYKYIKICNNRFFSRQRETDVNRPVSLLRLRACPSPKARVEVRVAARAAWTQRASLIANIFISRSSPSQNFTEQRVYNSKTSERTEAFNPRPLHKYTHARARGHSPGRSKSSVQSQYLCSDECVSWGKETRKLHCNYRSSRAQTRPLN